jgi:hypothetical protein
MGTHCAVAPLLVQLYRIQAVFLNLPAAHDANVNGVQEQIMGEFPSPNTVLSPYYPDLQLEHVPLHTGWWAFSCKYSWIWPSSPPSAPDILQPHNTQTVCGLAKDFRQDLH